MRADRLLAILLLLQRRGRITARELAERLEVSERTIYRDIESLGSAGVPVYAEPGRRGGIRLVAGYSTDLTGLSVAEAELLPLLGLADVLAGVGVGSSLRRTEAKVLAALGPDQRRRAEQSRRRIYVDLSRWWDHSEPVPYLSAVVEALFGGRRIKMSYRRGGDGTLVTRSVDPHGLVVQGGVWYLVAGARHRDVRTYRVSRIQSLEALNEACDVPEDFDLPLFWATRKEEFHMTREGYRVVAKARPSAVRALAEGHHGPTLIVRAQDDGSGWSTIEFTFETRWAAHDRVLGLGPRIVVLEPEELREHVTSSLRQMASLYRT